MIESAELRAVAERWLNAYIGGDGDAMANMASRHEGTRYIGTDPMEVWVGNDVASALPHHIAEIQDKIAPTFAISELTAYENGETGWASVSGTVRFGNLEEEYDRDLPLKITLVFALEKGVWRVVLCHNSISMPNPEVVGVDITRGLEALLAEMGDDTESTIRDSMSEGTVTLMFTDIVDSTTWLTRLGDNRWAEVVAWHDATIRGIVEADGGSVVKMLGDGVMAAFDSTRAAAAAATAIQKAVSAAEDQPGIEIRIGLHAGEVLSTGADYLGQAVNKAARIASAAAGGEIQVSTTVAALLSDNPDFEFGVPFDTSLKGLDGTHQVMPLVWS